MPVLGVLRSQLLTNQSNHQPASAVQVEEEICLKDSFAAYPVRSIAAFLRFCYRPEDACADNFKQVCGRDHCRALQ